MKTTGRLGRASSSARHELRRSVERLHSFFRTKLATTLSGLAVGVTQGVLSSAVFPRLSVTYVVLVAAVGTGGTWWLTRVLSRRLPSREDRSRQGLSEASDPIRVRCWRCGLELTQALVVKGEEVQYLTVLHECVTDDADASAA
jgi:hypothetical protein